MDLKLLNEIIKIIDSNGLSLTITILVIYFSVKYINQTFFRKFKKIKLNEHPIFPTLDTLCKTRIPNLKLGTAGRTLVFKDMLVSKNSIWKNVSIETIEDNSYVSNADFYNKNIKRLNDGVIACEKAWQDLGIPQIVIDKFNEWHINRVKLITEDITMIAYSNFYHEYEEKKLAILDLYSLSLVMTVLDAERTLMHLNGALTGKVYKGVTI